MNGKPFWAAISLVKFGYTLLGYRVSKHRQETQVRLVCFGLVATLALPSTVIAKDAVSDCIGTHFTEYHRIVSPHRSVSIERIQQWSNWCKRGFNAFQLAEQTRPCYQEQIHLLQQQAGGFLPITYEKSQQIKYYCRQQLWLSLDNPPAQSQTQVPHS